MLDFSAAGKITFTPKRRYLLAELLAQCDLNAPAPVDVAMWRCGDVGRYSLGGAGSVVKAVFERGAMFG